MPRPDLPAWNLKDLYPSPQATQLKKDLAGAAQRAAAFQKKYQGKLSRLSGDILAAAIKEYEALQDLLGRIGSYAQLLYTEDMSNPKYTQFYQNMNEKVTDISTALIFFTLELNKVADKDLNAKLKASKKLQHYKPWLEEIREFRKYQLSDEIEKVLRELSVKTRPAFIAGNGLVNGKIHLPAQVYNASLDFPAGIAEGSKHTVCGLIDKDIPVGQIEDFGPPVLICTIPAGVPQLPTDLKGHGGLAGAGGHGEQLAAISW